MIGFNNRENTRARLLKEISTYAFSAYEALLYLDAYPNSREALNFYNKYRRLEAKARADYESKYGPLTMPFEANEWNWTNGPWPWQLEEEVGS
ncbi:MAG: spore coat protein CotJB [Clostridia bacterium]|nr:spore coat protein CotJB [Clostridia bacterium]